MQISVFLTENDIGLTGAHQSGVFIPKSETLFDAFPLLKSNESNPRVFLDTTDPEGTNWKFTLVHYNQDGRDELRLLGVSPFLKKFDLKAGDELIFGENNNSDNVQYKKDDLNDGASFGVVPKEIVISRENVLYDRRSRSVSALTTLAVSTYLDLVESAYANRGGIANQRQPLITTTARRIRAAMVQDLKNGTILPPLVVGILVEEAQLRSMRQDPNRIQDYLRTETLQSSIIDGMQRTTALLDLDQEQQLHCPVRVEFWLASSVRSMVYRMLILNTGQVPWTLRRQIEVVFDTLIAELKKRVPEINVTTLDSKERRTQPGDFKASDLVELYLVFGARKEKVDAKEKLAEEFTKLDLLEATAGPFFSAAFHNTLTYLSKLDRAFSKVKKYESEDEILRFTKGRDLFSSQPASVGFVTAVALELFGRPGISRSPTEQAVASERVFSNLDALVARLEAMSEEEVLDFMAFPVLNEILSGKKAGKVGDFEREFFTKSFAVLLTEQCALDDLTPCWRAY